MALNDSCHLLRQSITLYKNLGGGLEQNLGGLEPLSPIASAATAATAPLVQYLAFTRNQVIIQCGYTRPSKS